MKAYFGLLILFLSTHLTASEPLTCDQLDLTAPKASSVLLGCGWMPGAENVRARYPDGAYPVRVEQWFDVLPNDEKLLARVVWRLREHSYPSREELDAYFEPRLSGQVKPTLADILTLGELWEGSADWGAKLVALFDKQYDLTKIEIHVLKTLLLDVGWWYETDEHLLARSIDPREVFNEQISSRIPWSSVYRARNWLPGGQAVESPGAALDTFKTLIGQTPAGFHLGVSIDQFAGDEFKDYDLPQSIRYSSALWVWGRALSGVVFYDARPDFFEGLEDIPPIEIVSEEIGLYGYPLFMHNMALSYLSLESAASRDRAIPIFERAAAHGMVNSIRWLLQNAAAEGDYEQVFRHSLHLASQGNVSLENYGYVLASMVAENAHGTEFVHKWRDFLALMCETQVLRYHGDKAASCPSAATERKYLPIRQDQVSSVVVEDIEEAGTYELNTGRYYAVLIGNSDYDKWTDLKTPIEDVRKLGGILSQQYGFEVETVENGDRREILRAIYDLGGKANFGDHVLVYYAGHGVVDRASDVAYWIPSDAGRDFAPDWVSAGELQNAFKTIQARHLLLVADSCYSGKLLRGDTTVASGSTESMVKRLFEKKARVAMTSGGEEPVVDSVAGSVHSVFAEALIKGLGQNKGPLPASALYGRVLTDVSSEASQTPQYADMRELGHDGGDFIFVPANW